MCRGQRSLRLCQETIYSPDLSASSCFMTYARRKGWEQAEFNDVLLKDPGISVWACPLPPQIVAFKLCGILALTSIVLIKLPP